MRTSTTLVMLGIATALVAGNAAAGLGPFGDIGVRVDTAGCASGAGGSGGNGGNGSSGTFVANSNSGNGGAGGSGGNGGNCEKK